MWWFRAWKGFSYWCLFVFVSAEVCSPQLGLCSHGDGCEGLWESNLQEVIAAGWSICSMRMAPEGHIVDVQLAICCGPADRARKLSSHPPPFLWKHTERLTFPNTRARDSTCCPTGVPRHIPDTELQTLSVGLPENILKWSDDSMWCIYWCAEWEWKWPQHGSLIGQRSLLFLIAGQVLRLFHSAPNRETITRPSHWRPVLRKKASITLLVGCWSHFCKI